MPFVVTVARSALIAQGLASPVRAAAGSQAHGRQRRVELRVGIGFDDAELSERGWFLDTDAVAHRLDVEARRLESATWTDLFTFRPTMELVSRDMYQRLHPLVDHLAYVELSDLELCVVTRYEPVAAADLPH